MPREQPGVIGQSKYLCADAFHQLACIASGEVRPSDTVLENQVAAEADSRFSTVEDHMPRRVSGSMAHLQGGLPQPKDLAVLEIDARFGSGIDLESKERRPSFR